MSTRYWTFGCLRYFNLVVSQSNSTSTATMASKNNKGKKGRKGTPDRHGEAAFGPLLPRDCSWAIFGRSEWRGHSCRRAASLFWEEGNDPPQRNLKMRARGVTNTLNCSISKLQFAIKTFDASNFNNYRINPSNLQSLMEGADFSAPNAERMASILSCCGVFKRNHLKRTISRWIFFPSQL
jgi:hypothetical protein